MKPYSIVTSTKDLPREEWLKYRRTGIGGSDAASVLGLNRFKSRYSLFADKLGLLPEPEDNEKMRLGRDLEQYVAERWSERTGKQYRRRNYMFRSRAWPWMLADIDREVVGENAGLECKTTSRKPEGIEDGKVPDYYYCQCVHYMAVMGYDRMYLAILVFGDGLYDFVIERENEQIGALAMAEEMLWNENIKKQIPPDTDGSDSTKEALAAVFPNAVQKEIVLASAQDIIELDIIREQIKELDKRKQEIENSIKAAMGDAVLASAPGYSISYPTYGKASVDAKLLKQRYPSIYAEVTKQSTYRRMTIKKENA